MKLMKTMLSSVVNYAMPQSKSFNGVELLCLRKLVI